jgi:hypothetical protein
MENDVLRNNATPNKRNKDDVIEFLPSITTSTDGNDVGPDRDVEAEIGMAWCVLARLYWDDGFFPD